MEDPLTEGERARLRHDDARAWLLLLPLAEAGNSDARFAVAEMFEHGEGTPKDESAAVRWYVAAGETGSHRAHFALGLRALSNDPTRGTSNDHLRRSFVRCVKLAAKGDGLAHLSLGTHYRLGLGVDRDLGAAIRHFTRALELGRAEAPSHLVSAFNEAGDETATRHWYHRAKAIGRQVFWDDELERLGPVDLPRDTAPPNP